MAEPALSVCILQQPVRHCLSRQVALGEWTAQDAGEGRTGRMRQVPAGFERLHSPTSAASGGSLVGWSSPTCHSLQKGITYPLRDGEADKNMCGSSDSCRQGEPMVTRERTSSKSSLQRRLTWSGVPALRWFDSLSGWMKSASSQVGNSIRRSKASRNSSSKNSSKNEAETAPQPGRSDSVSRTLVNLDAEAEANLESAAANPDASAEVAAIPSISVLPTLGRRPSLSMQVIIENQRFIDDCYTLNSLVIGKGSFGVVKKATLKVTGATRAVKVIPKERMKDKQSALKREIQIMKRLDHPNTLRLHELFEDDKNLYMITELCHGGDLLGQINQCGRLQESTACKVMSQIFRAVFYLHGIRIIHRDLKPENCLLSTADSPLNRTSSLRVADFGLSCAFTPGQVLKTRVGTTAFMSPQVIARHYNEACDLWSCGCIAYMLLCGYLPFRGKTEEETRTKVQESAVSFTPSDWLHVSERGMDLVSRLLTKDVQLRVTAEQALVHEWVRDALTTDAQAAPVEAKIVQTLRGFRSLNRFKRASLQVIASLLGEEQTRAPREAFVALDADGDGLVSLTDLRGRFHTPELVQAVEDGDSEAMELLSFLGIPVGRWKAITYTEFVAATFDRKTYCTKSVCWAAFNVFDTDGNGKISRKELSTGDVLGDLSREELARLVRDMDLNGDGQIDFEEFLGMMRDGEGFIETTASGARKSKKVAKILQPVSSPWSSGT